MAPGETATSVSSAIRNALASDAIATHPVQVPNALQTAAETSELRVSMQTQNLGQVELRARLQGDQLGAEISVQHREAHVALTSDLPSLHAALNERQVRVDQLTVIQDMSASSASTQDSANRQAQQSSTPAVMRNGTSQISSDLGNTAANSIANISLSSVFDSNGRLSVRA